MIQLVSPGLLGTAEEFDRYFVRRIEAGQYRDSDAQSRRRMTHRLSVSGFALVPSAGQTPDPMSRFSTELSKASFSGERSPTSAKRISPERLVLRGLVQGPAGT